MASAVILDSPVGPLADPAQTQIAALRRAPSLQLLWNKVRGSRHELAGLVSALCQIPAPTFQERARGDWAAAYLQQHIQAEADSDHLGNRWVELRGTRGPGPTLLASAHLDTVFPAGTECRVQAEGELLRGPGIGDNCAGLGILLTAGRYLVEAGLPFSGTLILAANVGEEGLGNLAGMRELCQRFQGRLSGALALDGGLGQIVGAAVGSVRYRIRVKGPGGHSWSAFGQPSAVHQLARIAARVTQLKVPEEPRTTFNIGVIGGGTSVNTIAAEAEFLLDLRSLDSSSLAGLEAQVLKLVGAEPVPAGLELAVERIGERPTGRRELTQPWLDIVRPVWRALGLKPVVTASSTDANMPLALGIRASTIGTCRGGGAHTLGEWLEASSLPCGLEAFLLSILTALEVMDGTGSSDR